MIKRVEYQGIKITKKEEEVIRFIETGSNSFWDSYYNYSGRKLRIDRPTKTICSWFNRIIKSLHNKELLKEIPFAFEIPGGGYIWANPGLNASKANFECITLQDQFQETRMESNNVFQL